MGNSIKPHLENAEKTGVCQLVDMSVKEWPPELRKLSKNLRTLDLSKNRLTTIPGEIGLFTMLKSLTLTNNRLFAISEEIGKLKKLETLILDHNEIVVLPKAINSLNALRTVSLMGNHIKEFPTVFCGLKHLDILNISHNRLTKLPDQVQELEVVELNLNQNQMNSIPSSLSKCPRLKVLRVEENCLGLDSFSIDLMEHSKIALFAIEGNIFSMKQFSEVEGHEKYMERFTATKKKM